MSKKEKAMRLMDAPIYRYRDAFYMAFYSSDLYVDVVKRWRGCGMRYLFCLVSLLLIPLATHTIIDFNRYFDTQLIQPIEALPPLYIENGQVNFDKPMPYLMKNKAGAVVSIIDTTGKITHMDKAYPELTVLVTKDTLLFRVPSFSFFFLNHSELAESKIFEQSMHTGNNEVFVGKDWVNSSRVLQLKWMLEVMFYPLMVGLFSGLLSALLLLLAFVGKLFFLIIFHYKLTFKSACRLSFVSSTATMVVFVAFTTLNLTLPMDGFPYIILLAVYFNYAGLCVRRRSRQMVLE